MHIFVVMVISSAVANARNQPAIGSQTPPACALSEADNTWLNEAINAWHFASLSISEIGQVDNLQAVFFDNSCVLTSKTVMTVQESADWLWESRPHHGAVLLPDETSMPVVVTSFTQSQDNQAYFVMSTPSVWRQANVDAGELELENLMTAVLLHEGTHVAQISTFGAQITRLVEHYRLPDSFNDDSIQERFQQNAEFRYSVEHEIELLFEAARANDDHTVRTLATEALAMLKKRRGQWFVGERAYLVEAEDLWLTLEGSGQWVGYRWLIDPSGAAMPESKAMAEFGRRSKWWTQKQGLAMVMLLDRLGDDWKASIFKSGDRTLVQLLEQALAKQP